MRSCIFPNSEEKESIEIQCKNKPNKLAKHTFSKEHNIMEHEIKRKNGISLDEDWKIYMSAKINLLLNKVNNR